MGIWVAGGFVGSVINSVQVDNDDDDFIAKHHIHSTMKNTTSIAVSLWGAIVQGTQTEERLCNWCDPQITI